MSGLYPSDERSTELTRESQAEDSGLILNGAEWIKVYQVNYVTMLAPTEEFSQDDRTRTFRS